MRPRPATAPLLTHVPPVAPTRPCPAWPARPRSALPIRAPARPGLLCPGVACARVRRGRALPRPRVCAPAPGMACASALHAAHPSPGAAWAPVPRARRPRPARFVCRRVRAFACPRPAWPARPRSAPRIRASRPLSSRAPPSCAPASPCAPASARCAPVPGMACAPDPCSHAVRWVPVPRHGLRPARCASTAWRVRALGRIAGLALRGLRGSRAGAPARAAPWAPSR